MTLTKLLSPEAIVAVGLSMLTSYGTFMGWRSQADTKIATLEAKVQEYKADHDAIIKLGADVAYIKEGVAELRQFIIPKKEAKNVP